MTVYVQYAQIARVQYPSPPNMFELRQAPVPYKQIAGTEPRGALRNPHKNAALLPRTPCHLFTCRPHPSHRSRKTDAHRRHPTSTAHARAPSGSPTRRWKRNTAHGHHQKELCCKCSYHRCKRSWHRGRGGHACRHRAGPGSLLRHPRGGQGDRRGSSYHELHRTLPAYSEAFLRNERAVARQGNVRGLRRVRPYARPGRARRGQALRLRGPAHLGQGRRLRRRAREQPRA